MGDVDLDHGLVSDWKRSADCRRVVEDAADQARDYWANNARIDTGRMRADTSAYAVQAADGWEGMFQAHAPYAGFQEYGTQHIQGMHLIDDITALIETGISRPDWTGALKVLDEINKDR